MIHLRFHQNTYLGVFETGCRPHLDHNNSNNAEDNLAFLCFVHHDEYDSRTSQSKGLTVGEVRQFRSELQEAIGKVLSVRVHFGAVTIPVEDPYAGQFIRLGNSHDSAEIELTPIPDAIEGHPRYAVTGTALWGVHRAFGPNLGSMSFIGTLIDGVIEHFDTLVSSEEPHQVRLLFQGDRLIVEERNWLGIYGMNVSFIGEYRRA
jgi:hypothetical protein